MRKKHVTVFAAVLTVILSVTLFSVDLLAAQKAGSEPAALQAAPLSATFNLHYTGKYCDQCHEDTPPKGGPAALKYGGDFKKLCGPCHDNAQGAYLHPVDITPSDEIKTKIPAGLPLKGGEITCSTCHDLYLQCRESPVKLSSVRGAPYTKRTDFCFKCHDEKDYVRLNPHNQIDQNGAILTEKCLYCHLSTPDEKTAVFGDIRLVGTVDELCRKCHVISGNHSGNYKHFVKPKPKTLAIMKASVDKYGIILPLDDDGKLTCVTCHNPHQKGVIPPDRPGAKGADSKLRFRKPNICLACHNF